MGRSWSRWSTQSGGIPSSSHESYSSVNREIHTRTLQVSDIRKYIGKKNYPKTVHSVRERNNRVPQSRYYFCLPKTFIPLCWEKIVASKLIRMVINSVCKTASLVYPMGSLKYGVTAINLGCINFMFIIVIKPRKYLFL